MQPYILSVFLGQLGDPYFPLKIDTNCIVINYDLVINLRFSLWIKI